jgi:phenylacetate-CoA ligase
MIILRGVNVFPTQIEEQIFRVEGLSPHYQIHLEREGRLDTMTVHVEVESGADVDGLAPLGKELSQMIKRNIGVSAAVVLEPSGGIERSMGKAKRVVDSRKRG